MVTASTDEHAFRQRVAKPLQGGFTERQEELGIAQQTTLACLPHECIEVATPRRR
ncbi:hypothetical protein D3C76_1429740 [compost metagenome]